MDLCRGLRAIIMLLALNGIGNENGMSIELSEGDQSRQLTELAEILYAKYAK